MHTFSFFLSILAVGSAIITTATVNQGAPQALSTLHSRDSCNTTTACTGVYELVDTYDATNFWDKFNLFSGADPTNGFVHYQTKSEAEAQGLIPSNRNDSVILLIDYTTTIPGTNLTGQGRDSVRIESKASYGQGLIVADSSHLPAAQCGVWPVFWTYAAGLAWPIGADKAIIALDIYEQWNLYPFNRQSLHVNATVAGNCSLAISHNALDPVMTNWNYTDNCDTILPANTGCSTWDFQSPNASPDGGIYALELSPTTNLWSWYHQSTPPDLLLNPDPSLWGPPGLLAGGNTCNIPTTFANQTPVLDIMLCGDAAGSSEEWAVNSGCAAATGLNACERYVAARPGDFEESWFCVRGIRVYQIKMKNGD